MRVVDLVCQICHVRSVNEHFFLNNHYFLVHGNMIRFHAHGC